VFLVRRLLERRGYKVTAVCDQQEAIDAVRPSRRASSC
jgi:two-component system, cell cycle sensor histidine kinase and response regulator CckA